MSNCEHISTSRDGTSYCRLAEDSVKRLERELADMTFFRDSEQRWANQYKQERDEARTCLLEAADDLESNFPQWQKWNMNCERELEMVQRWRKAAGLTASDLANELVKAGVYDAEDEQ